MPRFIIFNGPPRVGKDTLGKMLFEHLVSSGEACWVDKFAKPIKDSVAAMFSLTDAQREYYFETPEKDQPQKVFFGRTPRDVLIEFSERYAKLSFGNGIFGKLCLRRNPGDWIVIITDGGFQAEVNELEKAGCDCLVVQVCRTGLSFSGDSREWVAACHHTVKVSTDDDVTESFQHLVSATESWLVGSSPKESK